jgi:hypothetical protein
MPTLLARGADMPAFAPWPLVDFFERPRASIAPFALGILQFAVESGRGKMKNISRCGLRKHMTPDRQDPRHRYNRPPRGQT